MSIKFNDTSTAKNGLIQECERALFGADYGAISGNTKKLATFTYYINEGMSKFSTLAMESDTRWQWQDSNYTTLPVSYTDLNANETPQKDYEMSLDFLKINHVYVKDADGNYQPLSPIDEHDLAKNGLSPETFLSEAGMPKYYDKKGRSIFLYPAPATAQVTESEGLQVSYSSPANYFSTTDTVTEAGVPIPFMAYPALVASEMYAKRNQMKAKADPLTVERYEMENAIRDFYNKRDKDDKPQLRPRKRNYV